jgi:hypothetical protein
MYGFGYNHEGDSIPGWGGSIPAFRDVSFNLSPYAGSTVLIRWVMGTDPAFCTVDYGDGATSFDATLFGWIVDNITVVSGGDTVFYDDADGSSSEMTYQNLRRPMFWRLTTREFNSPTHSMWFPDTFDVSTMVITPEFSIPEEYLASLTFYAYCDFPDQANDSGSLEDYYQVYAIYDNGGSDTLVRLMYDYARDPWGSGWSIQDESTLFNGTLDLRSFVGMDLRLGFLLIQMETSKTIQARRNCSRNRCIYRRYSGYRKNRSNV